MRVVRPIQTALVKRITGKPWKYNVWVAAEICARISEGEPLIRICRDADMPHASTVHEWVVDNLDGFAVRYMRARKLGAELMFERAMEVALRTTNDAVVRYNRDGNPYAEIDGFSVQRAKLIIDTLKWSLSKIYPKRYGELSEKKEDEEIEQQRAQVKPIRKQLTREEWLKIYAVEGEVVKTTTS